MVVFERTRVVAGFSFWRSGFSHWAVRATFLCEQSGLVAGSFLSDHFGFPPSVLIPPMLLTRLSSGAGTCTIDPLKLVSVSCRPRLSAKRNLFCSPLEQTLAVTRGTGSVLTECTMRRIMICTSCRVLLG
jgi:hypothetical protein